MKTSTDIATEYMESGFYTLAFFAYQEDENWLGVELARELMFNTWVK